MLAAHSGLTDLRLAILYNDDDKVFSSVIVVTDRTVLDAQLQEAIHQINRTTGVVAHIDGLTGSKSAELAEAVESGTHIVVVTIQTFPYALDAISGPRHPPRPGR